MTMPFGKHKGEHIDDVPLDYLMWVYENCDLRSEALASAISARIRGRQSRTSSHSPPPPPPPPPPPRQEQATSTGVATIEKVVRAWHRQMAMKYHPDRGGTHEQMLLVNEGAELLKKLAGL